MLSIYHSHFRFSSVSFTRQHELKVISTSNAVLSTILTIHPRPPHPILRLELRIRAGIRIPIITLSTLSAAGTSILRATFDDGDGRRVEDAVAVGEVLKDFEREIVGAIVCVWTDAGVVVGAAS